MMLQVPQALDIIMLLRVLFQPLLLLL